MKIIIIENEMYLAQSIASKLSQHRFSVEIYGSIKEAMATKGDIYLLSTNLPGQSITPLIIQKKDKIIILMVNYINNDTVSEPLRLGAKDYILKPFMIEELLRKIEHYQEYQQLKKHNTLCQDYIDNFLDYIDTDFDLKTLTAPCVIETNYPRLADKIVFEYARYKKLPMILISLEQKDYKEQILNESTRTLVYLTNAQVLKKAQQEELEELLEPYHYIISTSEPIKTSRKTFVLNTESKLFNQNEILTIEEYIKFIVNTFQHQFPDTELSKKLGISRKSLWEKRKKYALYKKK
ncbi:MAG TPA: response regulator [Epsilonproteobacteria bacterium]|nr:response regulator [Campylobacterota bacterium]